MGREISERSNGDWWVIETSTNAFKRVSSVFDSKEAVLAALKVGGLAPYILEKFLTSNYIPSTFTTAGYTFRPLRPSMRRWLVRRGASRRLATATVSTRIIWMRLTT